MTTVALYARVSSRKQEQNNTIESQVVELERRIAIDGHKLLGENKFKDNGFGGWNLKREGLDELRDKVGEGQVDKIYIHSPDRLSRKSSHQMILLEEFEKEGAEVIFLNYKTENNPESKLLLGVQGLISEYECAKIMERSRRGKLHAARKGYISVMGNAPYGYRYIKHVDREKAKFEIDEKEAKIVKQLFMWVGQERMSLKETARRLKEMCITAPKGRRNWHSGTVCRMLRNPAYKGQAAFGKTNVGPIKKEVRAIWKVRKKSYSVYQTEKKNWIHIEIPNIVEEELFDIVQKQLFENKKRARMQQSGRKYLLQGLMVCQCCKYTYYGMSNVKGGRSYYRCPGTDANRFGGNRVCSSKSIRTDILEEVIWEEVKMVLKEPEAMTKVRLEKHENKQAKDEIEKRADKIEQGIERLAYVYARGHITKEKYDAEVEAMEKELKGIREQKEEVSDEKRLKKELDFITSSIESFSSEIESELNQADHETKLDIIRKLVQRIEVDDNNVHIVFRLKELALERQKKSVQHCIGIPVSSTGMTS
ncbi:recombinase family protein [Wolbachia endosymbiont of Cardiocondyla obscurior]|uniref:recombinase family protein n=1 Tax=Wolbachia endosymbiont of Cardiocondyla obscurior TaxID=2687307 RepID=UPI00157B0CDC|nr:recombinase family protein [Wolbachia endosymbiont of Cardiocondyla obscurior]